jgi:predicted  nucleic acid-binding Zn-ribbon protein
VESARHDLVILVRLQQIYDKIGRAIQERSTPPPEVQDLQHENRVRQRELEELEEQVALHRDELSEVRRKEEEWKIELEHFQRQKGMVTNEREFTAVISEIDYASKALEEAAQRRTELEAFIDETSSEIESRRIARPDEEAAHRDVVDGWEARKNELLESIHTLSTKAKELEESIKPTHRARFLRLLESKKGTAVSAVVEGSCSVCHYAVRPHLRQRVRRCHEIITCEHCHRILFLAEIIDSEPSEANAS